MKPLNLLVVSLLICPPQTQADQPISAITPGDAESCVVLFPNPLDSSTATDAKNYSIDGTPATEAKLDAERKVAFLKTTPMTFGKAHELQIKNLKDEANTDLSTSLAIEQGLAAWIKFDDLETTNTADASVNELTLTLFGTPTPNLDGKVLRSMSFDGEDDYGRFPTSTFDFRKGMTIAFWAKPEANGNWARFIDFGNGKGRDNIIFGRHFSSDDLYFEILDGPHSGGQTIAPDALELNKWQHFAVSVDTRGKVVIYKNGLVAKEGTNRRKLKQIERASSYVGRSNWPADRFYQGELDELRIYERVLSPSEIAVLIGDIKPRE